MTSSFKAAEWPMPQQRRDLMTSPVGRDRAGGGLVALRMQISPHTVRQYINRARVNYAALGRDAPSKGPSKTA